MPHGSFRTESNGCEISDHLKGPDWEQVCRNWHLPEWLETHHILRRGKHRHVPENLIRITNKAHHWCHRNPRESVLVCLWVKTCLGSTRHGCRPLNLREALDKACGHSITGHIEYLMSALPEDNYYRMLGSQVVCKLNSLPAGEPARPSNSLD